MPRLLAAWAIAWVGACASLFAIGFAIGVCRAQAPSATPPSTRDGEAAALLKRWAESYRQAKTLQYETITTYFSRRDIGTTRRVIIRFWARRPNLLRAEVEAPDPKENALLVSDGKMIWEYCSATKQYTQRPVPSSPLLIQGELAGLRYLPPSLFFHPDPLQAITEHTVAIAVRGHIKAGKETETLLVRDYERSFTVSVCNERDSLPRLTVEYILRDQQPVPLLSEERRNVHINTPLPDTLFVFTPPKAAHRTTPVRPADLLLKPGTPAPNFVAQDPKGGEVSLTGLRNHPVLLTFWAAWAPTARAQLAALQTLQTEMAQKGLIVLVLNCWDQPNVAHDYVTQNPDTTLLFWRDPQADLKLSAAYRLYGVRGLPTSYLLDANGAVVRAWIGYDDKQPAEWRTALAIPTIRKGGP